MSKRISSHFLRWKASQITPPCPSSRTRYFLFARLHVSPFLSSLPPSTLLTLRSLECDDHHSKARDWLDGFRIEDIPAEKYKVTYSRSSGPGGQHVNKTNSKATVRLTLDHWLPPFILQPLSTCPYYIPNPPSLLVSSQQSRSAPANLKTALSLIHETIVQSGRSCIRGQTSDEQKNRVKALIKAEEKRRRQAKDRAKAKKASRRKDYD